MPGDYNGPKKKAEVAKSPLGFEDPFGTFSGGTDSMFGGSPSEIAARFSDQSTLPVGDRSMSLVGRGLRGLLEESFRIRDANTQNRDQAQNFLMGQFDQNTGATITEDDMRTLFAQQESLLAGDFLANNEAIAESMGYRGAYSADLAAQSHADFQKNLAMAKGDVRIAKIQSDANDAMRNLNAAFSLGNFLAQGEDESGLYGLERYIEGGLALGSIGAQKEAAKKAADSAKLGGFLGLAGQIGGALLA